MVHRSPLAISGCIVNSRGGLLPMLSLFRGGFLWRRGTVLPLQGVPHFLRKKKYWEMILDIKHKSLLAIALICWVKKCTTIASFFSKLFVGDRETQAEANLTVIKSPQR